MIDIDSLRPWMGRRKKIIRLIGPSIARRYHQWTDRSGQPPGEGAILPHPIHLYLSPTTFTKPKPKWGQRGPRFRAPRFLPPISLRRRRWVRGSFAFYGDLRVGDQVSRTSQITDIDFAGITADEANCTVSIVHRIEREGHLIVEEKQSIGYSDSGLEFRNSPKKPMKGEFIRELISLEYFTFIRRYSEEYPYSTYNDQYYADIYKGYACDVIHAPHIAAYLLEFATGLCGSQPKFFEIQNFTPLAPRGSLLINAELTGDGVELWVTRGGDEVLTLAEARWS